ncbi:putative siderophore biosynthesis protein SbnA [Corynebacterium capitovis DSM 44611]|uniref:pyridoxal-phosphate dependent enzyme n=1 Tax=Corynebacterium capitovis TaxID=131081 RepID=UPI0003694777|nr:pyridoxal-phosphate dependent enzyme [Corynebacterium capitovis]WKD57777.1 putative siderophore biosynthesis protein SbnA [Corynebacterium capitovis DSM 44611]
MDLQTSPDLLSAVGRTPLVAFTGFSQAPGARVWGKLESFNPGGSAKDRTARALVQDATERGVLGPGSIVVESSSGNLGVALAREAVVGGWKFHCVVDRRTNQATLAHIRALGATIHEVTEPDPETGDWLTARRTRVAELKDELGAINLDQYSNRAAFDAHSEGTMREIVAQLGHAPDVLVVAVSTTGTVGGCARYIAEHGLHTRVVVVDAVGSVLFGGERGQRILPGYGAGVVTDLSRETTPDDIVRVTAAEAVDAARALAKSTGFLPGASGGAVCVGVEKCLHDDPSAEIVAIFHDDGRAYLDTVYNDEWVERNVR